jgi:CBS domain-containing protein
VEEAAMTHRKVSDVMTVELITVTQDTSFKEMAKAITDYGVSALPVLDAQGRVAGIVSEVDLLRKEEYQQDPLARRAPRWRRHKARSRAAGVTAGEIMTRHLVTISPEASAVAAARELDRHHVRRLVVTNAGGGLIGIVTPSDLLKIYQRTDEDIRAEILSDVITRYVKTDPTLVDVRVADGVVTLAGVVENKSMITVAVSMSRAVDGVVDVVSHLGYKIDDTPLPRTADITGY